MADKFGPYIQKLMTTILDKEQDEFVTKLAFNELKRLNIDIEEFLRKNIEDDSNEVEETAKRILLTEQEENNKSK